MRSLPRIGPVSVSAVTSISSAENASKSSRYFSQPLMISAAMMAEFRTRSLAYTSRSP